MGSLGNTAAIRDLVDFGRSIAERGFVESTAGNVSVRLDSETMLITASGSELGKLTPEGVSVVSLPDGNAIEGCEPSLERELHRLVYEARDTVFAVAHCQSPYATLLACRDDPPDNLDFIPEVPAYVRSHAYVPYAMPGSERLARSVARAFEDPEVSVVQVRNHGQVVVGTSRREVVRRAAFFEMACRLAVLDPRLRTIPADEAARLRDVTRDV